MRRSLPAIIGAICFEYHPESWDIETVDIGRLSTQSFGFQILFFRSKRNDFEHRFADKHFFCIDEFSFFASDIYEQRATGSCTGQRIFHSWIDTIAFRIQFYFAIQSAEIQDIGNSHIFHEIGSTRFCSIFCVINAISIGEILYCL